MATAPLPGFASPAVGFEAPFELLGACHERIRRSLALLTRLVGHIDATGHDDASRSAAADVLRYFDIAAPAHHEDEERHVFPRLLASGDAQSIALARTLQAEHREMQTLWAQLRPTLEHWANAAAGDARIEAPARALVDAFIALHGPHLAAEDSQAFDAARAGLDEATLAAIGKEMQRRRGA